MPNKPSRPEPKTPTKSRPFKIGRVTDTPSIGDDAGRIRTQRITGDERKRPRYT